MSDIRYEKHGRVRLITIDRADKMNSLDFAANDRLVEVWREFDADDEAYVAVITGSGPKSFCAGADLKTYTMDFARRPAPEFRSRFTNGPGFGGITRNLDIFKPILAAVNGFAISGGFELALACDLRVADKSARFAFPELRLGLVPGWGGTARLARETSPALLRDLLLTGRTLGAPRAYEVGLIQSPVARGEATHVAIAMARQTARFSPDAVAATKRLTKPLQVAELEAEKDAFVALFAKPTVREALARFANSTDIRPYL